MFTVIAFEDGDPLALHGSGHPDELSVLKPHQAYSRSIYPDGPPAVCAVHPEHFQVTSFVALAKGVKQQYGFNDFRYGYRPDEDEFFFEVGPNTLSVLPGMRRRVYVCNGQEFTEYTGIPKGWNGPPPLRVPEVRAYEDVTPYFSFEVTYADCPPTSRFKA